MPSIASMTALITWGDDSKMFGHTRLSRWTIASSTPSPTVPSAMCFTVVHAVCRDEEGHERVHVILAHPA